LSICKYTLKAPSGWIDKSMLIFSLPAPLESGVAPNIVVTGDHLDGEAGTDIAARLIAFATKRYKEMQAHLPDHAFHENRLFQVSGKPAAQILVSWQNGPVRLTQWVVFIAAGEEQVVVVTSTAADRDFLEHRPLFEKTLASLTVLN